MEASYGPSTRVVLRVIIILIAVGVVIWVISKITGIILLLVLSIFFAYLVSPLVEFIRRQRTFGDRTVSLGSRTIRGGRTASFRGSPREVMVSEMTRLKSDRASLRHRLLVVLDQARSLDQVDGERVVVAGAAHVELPDAPGRQRPE